MSLRVVKVIASRAFVIRSVSQRHPAEGIDSSFARILWIIVFRVSRLILLFGLRFARSCFVCDLDFCFGFFDSLNDLFVSRLFRPTFNVFKVFSVVGNSDRILFSKMIKIKNKAGIVLSQPFLDQLLVPQGSEAGMTPQQPSRDQIWNKR